jgi:hypothetical protein
MRSKLIYGALRPLGNRYTLCQLASQATRKFHKPNTRIQETMNEVFNRFAQVPGPEAVMRTLAARSQKVAQTHRQAA